MTADTKTFRAKHGLTQAQLAELLPVNLRTLQEWESEREKGQPMPFLWRALAHLEAELNAPTSRQQRRQRAQTENDR